MTLGNEGKGCGYIVDIRDTALTTSRLWRTVEVAVAVAVPALAALWSGATHAASENAVPALVLLALTAFAAAPVTTIVARRLRLLSALVLTGSFIAWVAVLLARPLKGPFVAPALFPSPGVEDFFGLPLNPNVVAYLLLPAPLFAAALCFAPLFSKVARAAWAVAAIVGVLGLVATGARSSLLAVLVGFAVLPILMTGERRVRVALGGALVTAVAGAGIWIILNPEIAGDRPSLWWAVVSHGYIGEGAFGKFAEGQLTEPILLDSEPPFNVHNLFLQTAIDFGYLGLVMLLVILALSLRRIVFIFRTATRELCSECTTFALACAMTWAASIVVGLAESTFSTAYLTLGGQLVLVVSPVTYLVWIAPLNYDCRHSPVGQTRRAVARQPHEIEAPRRA